MSIQIGDGKGAGSLMEVKGNRAQVDADIHTALSEHSEKGNAYIWTNVTFNYTAADTIIGIRNTSSSNNLHISRIIMSGDIAQIAQIHVVNGSAALAGTVITGVNLNGSSGNVAEADARGDETTNSSQGTLIVSPELVAAVTFVLDLEGALILSTNQMLGVDFVGEGATCHVTVFGFFD